MDLQNPNIHPNHHHHRLLAAIDMGTNSFKMVLIKAQPDTGRFLSIDRLREPVLLGRGTTDSNRSILPDSQSRAISALRSFSRSLQTLHVHDSRVIATSAVREAPNRAEFIARVRAEVGLQVDVLSGEEEARLIYLGVSQCLPVRDSAALVVDIGGGSTEFVVGNRGEVLFAASLKLGHVCLTEMFGRDGRIADMRGHVNAVLKESALAERVRELGFDVAVGSSGTVRSIGKVVGGAAIGRRELGGVVEALCGEGGGAEGARRIGFPKRRAGTIVAGAVLLAEVFEALGVAEMRVSEYALGEGVVAEMLRRGRE
ncbi:hypothetical protein QJS04_geneDACA007141 [Acorus gramineus]|uniref:Ppx/GppA phosphatase N-terminal domain-containing protein n=1 Tax=Acorus gramineus TaxID=55184 RepID=A0AAV9BQN3_ACOGR|nr:hypothetical protein QJS04_geneDACA007141 [Acorus gramineus]